MSATEIAFPTQPLQGEDEAPLSAPTPVTRGLGERRGLGESLALACTFVRAAACYWLAVFPRAAAQQRHWRRRAALIADRQLRQLALDAFCKRENVDGAAAFATFVPRRHRACVVRALVAFHVAYSYVDLLAEQPHDRSVENARRLHEALLAALDVDTSLGADVAHGDHYALHPCREDGGYLAELLDVCRGALRELPGWPAVAAPARTAAARIVEFQSMSLGTLAAFEQWARAQSGPPGVPSSAPDGDGLRWWELGAACGSSLGVDVLIAAAAMPSLSVGDLAAIEDAYIPWIAALHSLLDSLVDMREDAATGQLSLVGRYPTPRDAASRMRWLTERALRAAETLPDGRRHELLVTAMACQYLSAAPASMPARAVREALGWLAAPVLLVFAVRRLLERAGAGAA